MFLMCLLIVTMGHCFGLVMAIRVVNRMVVDTVPTALVRVVIIRFSFDTWGFKAARVF